MTEILTKLYGTKVGQGFMNVYSFFLLKKNPGGLVLYLVMVFGGYGLAKWQVFGVMLPNSYAGGQHEAYLTGLLVVGVALFSIAYTMDP